MVLGDEYYSGPNPKGFGEGKREQSNYNDSELIQTAMPVDNGHV